MPHSLLIVLRLLFGVVAIAAWLYAASVYAYWLWLFATDGSAAAHYARTGLFKVAGALVVMSGLSFLVIWHGKRKA